VPQARDDGRDRELLRDLASGRAEALAELYDRHAGSLYRHALALARNRSDAEDLVQAVFVKLATTGAELLGVRAPASYLHRILHTSWIDRQRRRVTGERVAGEVGYEARMAVVPRAAHEEAIDLSRALATLPATEQEVIVLHLTEGFSFREIGKMTGVSLFTAAGRYRQGIRRLRRIFGVNEETSGHAT